MLKLRRIVWDDGQHSLDPEDHNVVDGRGEKIGRIYRTIAVGGGHVWRWSVYSIAIKDKWDSHRHSGLLPTREAAQHVFKAAWATCEPRARGG